MDEVDDSLPSAAAANGTTVETPPPPFLLCYRINSIVCSSGVWVGDHPFDFSVPLLLAQIVLIFVVTTLTHALLRHLGQPRFISHVIAGIILGPSVLCRNRTFKKLMFPFHSLINLDVIGIFASMLFIFVIAVKTNFAVVRSSGRRGVAIAEAGTVVSFFVSLFACFSILPPQHVGPKSGILFLLTMARWAVTSNTVLACLLDELNLLTSKLGRLAISASLVADMQHIFVSIVGNSFFMGRVVLHSASVGFTSFWVFSVFTAVILLVMRPTVLWMVRRTPEGGPMDEARFLTVVMMAVGCGFMGEVLGHNIIVGPLMFGLALPGGPPLGTTLTDRLERFLSGMLLPVYMVLVGLRTDLFAVGGGSNTAFYNVLFGVCTTVKFAAVVAVSRFYCRMPFRDSIVVGLMMSCRGIVELHTINDWHDNQMMDGQFYAIAVLWILGVGGVSAALLKFLYKPSVRLAAAKRRTVYHSPCSSEFRILACVHHPENVPPFLAILSTSVSAPHGGGHHRSPVGLYLLHLLPLVGRTSGVLAPYGSKKRRHGLATAATDAIVNAFRSLEWTHPHISFLPFVSTSPYVSMHEDVCDLAADKRAVLIALPFHKHFSAGGIECTNPSIRSMNVSVLRYAPCSVAIIIDRRRQQDDATPARSTARGGANAGITRSVTVLFLGGADDREALACGARMTEDPAVRLTVVRVLQSSGTWEGGADEEAVEEFMEIVDGSRVVLREETVGDGMEMVEVLKGICEECMLLIVGRREGMESAATVGLDEWREYPELGVIGDMLAVAEFGEKVLTLVVQQQQPVAVKGKGLSGKNVGDGGRVHDDSNGDDDGGGMKEVLVGGNNDRLCG